MTKINRIAAAAALAAALGATGLARAEAGHGHRWGSGSELDFEALDSNADGTLTREELTARAVERFSAADTNGDTNLDRGEIAAQMPFAGGALIDVFGPNRAEQAANRILAMVGATEAGEAPLQALADQRVNLMLSFVDENGDSAISETEAEGATRFHDRFGRRGPRGDGPGRGDAPEAPGE